MSAVFNIHRKPNNQAARREECKRITDLMTRQRPFSFLRLGDMELQLLIASQKGEVDKWCDEITRRERESSVQAFGHPGLKPAYVNRLKEAYENCTYLDYQHANPTIKTLLSEWQHARAQEAHSNPEPNVSELFLEWTQHEFRDYVEGRPCLFVGAEARLLKNLLENPSYRAASRKYWPDKLVAHFYETGDIGDDLDRLKDGIRKAILAHNIDTVFISLGGGAKILAYELARETGIAAFDFGSIMRGLTYSGSDGHKFMRASHYPFFFRVPFGTWMNALQDTVPSLSRRQLLIKAHAQLALEVIRKEEGWTYPSEWISPKCIDLSGDNLRAFWNAYRVYKEEFASIGSEDVDAMNEVNEFSRWRKHQGIGVDGKVARFIFRCKVHCRKMLLLSGRRLT
jgi:hypothetical protein